MNKTNKNHTLLKLLTVCAVIISIIALFLPLDNDSSVISNLAEDLARQSSKYKQLEDKLTDTNGLLNTQKPSVKDTFINQKVNNITVNQTLATNSNNTDQQILNLESDQLSISNGNSLDLSIYKNDSDNQKINWDPNTRELSLINGGTVIISDTNTVYTAGSGLKLINGQFHLDPADLSQTNSITNSDELIVSTDNGPKKISYNDLFGNILGSLNYRGTWDANNNSPDLTNYCNSSTKGHYYVVSNSGSSTLGSYSSWRPNDWVVCNGSSWQQIESTNDVISVFGRQGAVTAQKGDYSANQINFSPTSSIISTDVQGAIEELTSQIGASVLTAGDGISINGARVISSTLGTNIDSAEIIDGTIISADIKNNSISSSKILDGTILSADIADGALTFADWSSNGCLAGQVPQYSGTNWSCSSSSLPTIVKLNSDITNNNVLANTLQDLTGLNFNVQANINYTFRCTINFTSQSTITGSRWTINGPSTSYLGYRSVVPLTTISSTTNNLSSYNLPTLSNTSSPSTAGNLAVIEGSITPNVSGVVQVKFASELSGSAITAKAGSTCTISN